MSSSMRRVPDDPPGASQMTFQGRLRNADGEVCVSPSRVWRVKKRNQEMGQLGVGGGGQQSSFRRNSAMAVWNNPSRQHPTVPAACCLQFWWKQGHTEHM